MTLFTKDIIPDGASSDAVPARLTCMIHDIQPERSFPSVIVVPGGSYVKCSKREGEPCAARFYSYGYNTFILEYSVIDKPFPIALKELCEAIRFIREERDELHATDEVHVLGFSAGGHLAACLGAYHSDDIIGGYKGKVTPDSLILCYPVITMGEYTHLQSRENIAPDIELRKLTSVEHHVRKFFPPTFIWQCADDKTVPVMNSLMLAQALSENDVPFELHIFPKGGHAVAMCDVTSVRDGDNDRYILPDVAVWSDLALTWLRKTGH